jgi:hypothetical protein
MVENDNYLMAIDLLCCHLGINEDEAREQLGISNDQLVQRQVIDTQHSLMGLHAKKK